VVAVRGRRVGLGRLGDPLVDPVETPRRVVLGRLQREDPVLLDVAHVRVGRERAGLGRAHVFVVCCSGDHREGRGGAGGRLVERDDVPARDRAGQARPDDGPLREGGQGGDGGSGEDDGGGGGRGGQGAHTHGPVIGA